MSDDAALAMRAPKLSGQIQRIAGGRRAAHGAHLAFPVARLERSGPAFWRAALACLALGASAQAQTNSPDPIAEKKFELRGVEETLGASSELRKRMESEVAAQRLDRAQLNEALMDAVAKVEAADSRLAAIERRLDDLLGQESAIRVSLEARRGLIAEILGVLQRVGRRPPPALLANPEDILSAIRASMALGGVVPELRAETQALMADLQGLSKVRAGIASEKDALLREQAGLSAERFRLSSLMEARQKNIGEAESALDAERRKSEELARQATSLKDLIARMEADVAGAQKALEEARKAEETRKIRASLEAQDQQAKIAASPFKDMARLAPAAPFPAMRGKAPLPVAGQITKAFGASDAFGGTEKGVTITARPRAPVVSPADGWVVFAAPYRGYGQMLILNAGDGYYIVLSGLDRIHVAQGQFVLAGEPVAALGDGAVRTAAFAGAFASQTGVMASQSGAGASPSGVLKESSSDRPAAIGGGQPELYVEFRKDNVPIDPSPWWAAGETKRVR